MEYSALRAEWRRLYRAEAPRRVWRDLLMLGVAWKIQERAIGGLGAATKRRLADLAKTLERDGDVTPNRVARLKPGAKLIREWRGKTYTVTVLEDGSNGRAPRGHRCRRSAANHDVGAQGEPPCRGAKPRVTRTEDAASPRD